MKRTSGGRVAILTGSQSDLAVVGKIRDSLADLGITCELRVLSAHRSPQLTADYVRLAEARGVEVFVACAGMANHLAGAVAANTRLPVIGVPLVSGRLGGLDSLLSTVQMPPGVPVAVVSIDGVSNAAFLAARILGIKYPVVRERLERAADAAQRHYADEHAAAESQDRPARGGDQGRRVKTARTARRGGGSRSRS